MRARAAIAKRDDAAEIILTFIIYTYILTPSLISQSQWYFLIHLTISIIIALFVIAINTLPARMFYRQPYYAGE